MGQRQDVDRAVCWRVPGACLCAVPPEREWRLGGSQIGYNWQLDRTWVLGFEGESNGPASGRPCL